MNVFGIFKIKDCLLFICFFHPSLRDSFFFGTQCEVCIYKHIVSTRKRSRLGLVSDTRGSRLGLVSDSLTRSQSRLGLGSSGLGLGLCLDPEGLGLIPAIRKKTFRH